MDAPIQNMPPDGLLLTVGGHYRCWDGFEGVLMPNGNTRGPKQYVFSLVNGNFSRTLTAMGCLKQDNSPASRNIKEQIDQFDPLKF